MNLLATSYLTLSGSADGVNIAVFCSSSTTLKLTPDYAANKCQQMGYQIAILKTTNAFNTFVNLTQKCNYISGVCKLISFNAIFCDPDKIFCSGSLN